MSRASWSYKGHTVERTASSGMWVALVNLPGYAGFLKADTKAGMRELIRHYS